MIELMLPVAVQAEAEAARTQFGATSAAIAGAFQKNGAKPFLDALDGVITTARGMRQKRQSEKPAQKSAASQVMSVLGRMGLQMAKGKR